MKTLALISYLIYSLSMPFGGHNLSIAEVESILGEPCKQLEKTSTAEEGGHQFETSFIARDNDKVHLFYMFESFKTETEANKLFDEFVAGNNGYTGFEKLENLGSEAFYHTDGQGFSLIVARLGNELVRIKVNKLTPKYSKKEHERVISAILARVN